MLFPFLSSKEIEKKKEKRGVCVILCCKFLSHLSLHILIELFNLLFILRTKVNLCTLLTNESSLGFKLIIICLVPK